MNQDERIAWLLDSDPSIRWQVLRDLVDAPERDVAGERELVAAEGWGARLLACQDRDGRWAGQLYDHKWLSTTYSLLLLRQMGLDPINDQACLGCRVLLDAGFQPDGGICLAKTVDRDDNVVTGMVFSLLAYFDIQDARVHAVANYLLGEQQPDGRWEPETGITELRYELVATLQILEGLNQYAHRFPGLAGEAIAAQERGRQFLLRHRLVKTDGSGEAIHPQMTLFSFPSRWHYDVLAALDYFQACRAECDDRLSDAIDLVRSKQNRDGCWTLQNRHPGKTFFEMESVGKPSRWNTLRALRVLKWWEGE